MCPPRSSSLVALTRITNYIKSLLPRKPPKGREPVSLLFHLPSASHLLPGFPLGQVRDCTFTSHTPRRILTVSIYRSLTLHYPLCTGHKQFLPFLFLLIWSRVGTHPNAMTTRSVFSVLVPAEDQECFGLFILYSFKTSCSTTFTLSWKALQIFE